MHHDLFQSRNFPIALVAIFVDGLSFFTANAYFARQFSTFTGAGLLKGAMAFSIFFVGGTCASIFFGFFVTKYRLLRAPGVLGLSLIVLFNVLMATTTPATPGSNYWGYAVFAGLGLGSVVPTFMVVAQMSTPPQMISLASGLDIVARPIGGVVGLAVNTAIFNSAAAKEVPSRIAAAVLPLGLPQSSLPQLIGDLTTNNQAGLATVPGASPAILEAAGGALLSAFHIAFRNCWIGAAALCLPGVIGKL